MTADNRQNNPLFASAAVVGPAPLGPLPQFPRAAMTKIKRAAFTLVEVLVVVTIIALLLAILLPSLGRARESGRSVKCLSQLQQMGLAWMFYAEDFADYAMPLAYWQTPEPVYWWGRVVDGKVDHAAGFLWPYLRPQLRTDDLFQCPSQPWGTYRSPDTTPGSVTSTYGYNGYYLTPKHTPGWGSKIGFRPWQRTTTVLNPTELFVFADTLIATGTSALPKANPLLDPPWLFYRSGMWRPNSHPTTAFRHAKCANALSADGHVQSYPASQGTVRGPFNIGYVGRCNAPHYVPDYRHW